WPNRIGDGRYSFDGVEHTLALTEPEKLNAIHGLLRWVPWRCTDRSADAVTLVATVYPSPGYPFALEAELSYRLGPEGLSVRAAARNVGPTPCPYGFGQHPYLSGGDGVLVDDCVLQFGAGTRIDTDADRQLPTADVPVAGTDYDFRAARRVGPLPVDFAFTDLDRDADGRAWLHLTGPDRRTASLWVDDSVGYLEVFTGDTLHPDRARRSLGVEPMTCPPNAFQSGRDVIRLAPGGSTAASWGLALSG
ncbi:MAG TPA: aldose 1-epimerase family protein, partial [Candidatus Nanopelagicales bacterium]|nr:aldose 1-epimerase family protein [Candidatus Nanopelagicales bacterium]